MGKRKSHSKKDKENFLDEQYIDQSNSQSIKPPARKKAIKEREEVIIDSDEDQPLVQSISLPTLPNMPLKLAPSKQQQLFTPSLPRTISQTMNQSNSQSSDEFGDTARKLNFVSKTMATPGRPQMLARAKCDPMLVFCRVRPLTEKEKREIYQPSMSLTSPTTQSDDCINVIEETKVLCLPPKGSRSVETKSEQSFTFSHVFDPSINQSAVFDRSARPLVTEALSRGHNLLMFAYGVTNSGKTYTMTGGDGDHRGIIPRAIEQVFEYINQPINQSADHKPANPVAVNVSFLEIYNEKVLDLLSLTQKETPRVCTLGEDKLTDSVYVKNLTEVKCSNESAALQVVRQGNSHRKVSKTLLNQRSSRSHSVFIIRLIDSVTGYLWSKISIVDLAGSERQNRTHDQATTTQSSEIQKEANAINNSLSTLGRCLNALRENSKANNQKLIPPFRESALTRLFKDSFCGIGRTMMLCAVSPTAGDYDESVLALKYSAEANEIKFATVNNNQPIAPSVNQSINQSASKTLKQKRLIESSPIKDDEPFTHSIIQSINQSIDPEMIDRLNSKISSLQDEYCDQIYQLKQKIADLTNEMSEQESINRSMNVDLMDSQAAQYEQELDQSITRTINQCESEAQQRLKKQSIKLKQEYEETINQMTHQFNQSINQLSEQKSALEAQLIDLENRLNDAEKLYADEKSTNESINQSINEHRSMLERARDQLIEVQQEHDQSINHLNASVDELTKQLKQAIAEKESINQSMQHSINQLTQEHETAIEQFQSEISELNQSITQLTEQSISQSTEIESLTNQIDEHKSINQSLNQSMQQQIEEALEAAQQAEADREHLIHQHNQSIEESINQSIEEQKSIHQPIVDRLTEKINQLTNQLTEQSNEHQQSMDELQGENQSINQSLNQYQNEIDDLKQENQSVNESINQYQSEIDDLKQENQSVNQLATQYQQLLEKFESVCGVSIELFLEHKLLNQPTSQSTSQSQDRSSDQSNNQSTNQSVSQSVNPPKKTRQAAKRASMIQSEDFIHSVDIQAATPLKPSNHQINQSRKGKRLSITIDQSINQSNNKTAPASSIVHALNECRSLDLLTSPAPQRKYMNQSINQSISQSSQPPSPSTRTRFGINQSMPTPMMSPAVMKVLKGKSKSKTKTLNQSINQSNNQSINQLNNQSINQSNNENSANAMNVFDFPTDSVSNQSINQSVEVVKEKKSKKTDLSKLKAAISKTNQSQDNQSINQSINQSNDWDAVMGETQAKYSRAVPQATPVAKRTRNRTHA